MREEVNKLFDFSRFLNAFARVDRVIDMPEANRKENDMEHSYHLALVAWYLISSRNLDLDLQRVLEYSLAHDLVEVHAGDTYVWSKDETEHATKKEREEAAATQIKSDFPEFPGLHSAIRTYEDLADRESRFVYALDKIVPLLLIQEDGGRLWREMNVTLDMIVQKKTPQVALSPEVASYFEELVAIIREAKVTAEPA